MKDLFDVKGKVIVVTGGGGVLCGQMARSLGAVGGKIAVLDLNETAAGKVAEEINLSGGKAVAVKCNVLDKESIETAEKTVTAEFGKVDILINGAGGNKKEATTSPDMSFFDLPSDAIRFVFDLNFIGTLLPSQVFGKQMAENGAGVILNIVFTDGEKMLAFTQGYEPGRKGFFIFSPDPESRKTDAFNMPGAGG